MKILFLNSLTIEELPVSMTIFLFLSENQLIKNQFLLCFG